MQIPQACLATATSQAPARDILDIVNARMGFEKSMIITGDRMWVQSLKHI